MASLYYTPPSDDQFKQLQLAAEIIWREYDDTYGYATEKADKVLGLQNVGDNFMYIVAMFDIHNQRKLAQILDEPTRRAVSDRMIDGGMPPEYNPFL